MRDHECAADRTLVRFARLSFHSAVRNPCRFPHPLLSISVIWGRYILTRCLRMSLPLCVQVVVVDDEDRENEGDLILAAEFASPETINFMAQHARGLICLALEGRKVDELGLSMMAARNESKYHSPFTLSMEALQGITTGTSCSD